MQFQFSFKKMESSDALTDYTKEKVLERVSKYVSKPIEAHVTFSVDGRANKAHCSVVGGDNFNVEVEHAGEDMYASVDMMIDKLASQLKRAKEKLKEHRSRVGLSEVGKAMAPGGEPPVDAADVLKYEQARKKK
jgi:ribosomal subunit interface protein